VSILVVLGVIWASVGTLAKPVSAADSWWNNAWSHRALVTVTEQSGAALTDYQVKVIVPYDADMKADYSDVRFINTATSLELSYWLEKYTVSSATFWVKVPSIPASGTTTFYMYYGNASATSNSDIHNTFIFGDDFEDPAFTAAHIVINNMGPHDQQGITTTVPGGTNHVWNQNGDNFNEPDPEKWDEPIAEIGQVLGEDTVLTQFPDNYIAEVDVYPLIDQGGAFITARYAGVDEKYEQLIDMDPVASNIVINRVVSDTWNNLDIAPLATPITVNTWYKLGAVVIKSGITNTLQVLFNDVSYFNREDASLPFNGLAFLTFSWDSAFSCDYDNFRVRAFASIEPLVTLGSVEQIIAIAAISGVTAPVAGAIPVTEIVPTSEYTGTVSWSPAVVDTFIGGVVYTATITLTPKSGYTLTGVAADYFTLAGATSVSNLVNSGVVTAVFPGTAWFVTYLSFVYR
jgi:hypothetical protein